MITKGYGFSINDIDWACPADLEPYAKAHNLEITERDSLVYSWIGYYALSAVSVAVERNLHGKKSKSKFVDKTISQLIKDQIYKSNNDRSEYDGMTDEEKQKAELERAKDYFNSLLIRSPKI